jgi:uncharacterized protein (TIGR03382 family)
MLPPNSLVAPMKFFSTTVLAVFAICLKTHAAVTLNFYADQLRDAGGTAISSTALVVVVADTNRDGFSSLLSGGQLTLNGLIGGADNRVIARFDASVWGDGAAQNPANNVSFEFGDYTNWEDGDPLALFWFPELTISSTSLSANNTYGQYLGPLGSDGVSWATPSDQGDKDFIFYTQAGNTIGPGPLPAAAGNASNTVSAVPEPSVSILAMAGAMFAVLGRRRRENRHP